MLQASQHVQEGLLRGNMCLKHGIYRQLKLLFHYNFYFLQMNVHLGHFFKKQYIT